MQEKRTDIVRRFFLVRHGDTDYGLTHDFTLGPVNLGLNELGRKQAAAAAQSLKKILGDLIPYFYTSTLLRAIETTEIIKGPFPEAEVFEERLIEEHYYGDYSTIVNQPKTEPLKQRPKDAKPWWSFTQRVISSIANTLFTHFSDLQKKDHSLAIGSLKNVVQNLIPYFYTSTLLRAIEATEIEPSPEAKVIEERSVEEHSGDYATSDSKSKTELLKQKPKDAETWLTFAQRIMSSTTKILFTHFSDQKKKDHPLVIVSHKGVFEMMSLFLTGTLESIGNAEIVEFVLKTDGTWEICRLSEPMPEDIPILSKQAKKMKDIEDELRIYTHLVKVPGNSSLLTIPRDSLFNLLQLIQRMSVENEMLFEENNTLRKIIQANGLELPAHVNPKERGIPVGSYLREIQFFSSTNTPNPPYPNKRVSFEAPLDAPDGKKIIFQFRVIRHADTDWKFDKNKKPEDLPVNTIGRQQGILAATLLLKQLIDFSNTVLITSSQKRSFGTAQIFLELTQASVTTLIKQKAFSGLYYGDYTTIKDDGLKPKDAESIRSFQKRVSKALYKMILQHHQAQPLILFTHRRVFEFLSLYLLGTMLRIECGEIGHFVCYEDGNWDLTTFKYEENSEQFVKSKVEPQVHCIPPYITDEEEALNKIRAFLLRKDKHSTIDKSDLEQWLEELYKEDRGLKKILKEHLQNDRVAYHNKLKQEQLHGTHPDTFLNSHTRKNADEDNTYPNVNFY